MNKPNESNQNIRTIIYGAGAVGCVVGGHLTLAGKDVVLVGRPGHINSIREKGLRFTTPTKTHTLHIPTVTEPAQIDYQLGDVIFLCVKGQDTDTALRDLSAVAPRDIPIFCFQNGVSNEETATRHFSRIYGVMVRVGGVFVTNGEVVARRDPPGWFAIGIYPTGTNELVEDVAENLREAGFHVTVTKDIMPHKWGKLMLNLGNAIDAITDSNATDTNHIVQKTREEASDILGKAGIGWISTEEATRRWPEAVAAPRHSIKTEEQSSTWQSLVRKQGTVETKLLNGEIVQVAESLGLKAPLNEKILFITEEMALNHDLPGKYTPMELSDLLGID
ncbi:ketopantoate reductase family protein [Chloroflexota bacterium]